LGGLTLSTGCRTASEQFRERATARGLRAEVVAGASFQHLVLSSPERSGRTLAIYFDGDCSPYVVGYPAVDPTPRDPLVLDLMTLDPEPAVYVGRPCYHGLGDRASCAAALW